MLDEQHGQVEVVAQASTISSPSSSTSSWLRPLAGSSSISSRGRSQSARASSTRLSVPYGQPAGGAVGDVGEAEPLERLVGLLAHLALLAALARQRQRAR